MAIKAPTPPTPPTVPVVPGAEQQQSDSGQSGQPVGNGQDNGREFGVHVTISNPKENNGSANAQQGVSQSTGTGQGSEAQPNGNAGNSSEQSQPAQGDVAQQARQDMVQQALGMKDDSGQQGQEAAQQNVAESPWAFSGSHMLAMSFMPLLIVFVAAFITFMLRNLSKKPKLKQKPPAKSRAQAATQTVYEEKAAAQNEKKNKGSHFEMRI